MMILISVVSLAGLTMLIEAFIRYRATQFGAPVALSDVQQAACGRIVDAGLGRAWICRKALANGECSCVPCHNLEQELAGELAMTAGLRK